MKFLKWLGIIVGGLIALIVVAVAVLFFVGQGNLNSAPEVATAPVTAATGDEALARGAHLVRVSSCNECHGANLGGTVFIDESPIGYIPASNLTSGAGGIGSSYTDADWEKAIRHGIAADGRTITIMSTNHYAHYGDDDLASLIAYLKSVPPVDNEMGPRAIQLPGNIIFGVLANSSWGVNTTDHAAVGGPAPAVEPSAEYGQYLTSIASCQSCHAENLAGNYGQLDSSQGPNLTPSGNLGSWTYEDFATALRTGQTPDGRQLSMEMPWPNYSNMSDVELQALWAYLQTVAPLPNNSAQ